MGGLSLIANARVKLVDRHDNSVGSGREAVYVDALIVSAGSILDLNGINLYARTVQLNGSIVGGTYIQIPDSGPIQIGHPTSGTIGVAGELDEWTFLGFAGRKATIVVNPGETASPAPVSPRLQWANVRLIDPSGNVVASGASTSTGQAVTLANVSLASTGTYKVRINAPTGHASLTGHYIAAVHDVTLDSLPLTLNQTTIGSLSPSFNTDEWFFSVSAGRQIRLDFLGSGLGSLLFTLRGPDGSALFSDLTGDSELITIAAGKGGRHTLAVRATGDQTGTYSFAVRETSIKTVNPGSTHTGTLAGPGDAQVFRVITTTIQPLFAAIDASSAGARVELYARRGAPPTRRDFDHRAEGTVASAARVLVSSAPSGDWYFLMYAADTPANTSFTFRSASSPVHISSFSPDRYASSQTADISVTGAGFIQGTEVSLVSASGQVIAAQKADVDSYSRLLARFNLTNAATGTYSLKVTVPGGHSDAVAGGFQVMPAGAAKLETRLVMPSNVGRHALATFYVEYANTGNAAMPAPLIRLQSADPDGSDIPILTLDQSRLTEGFWTSGMPDGFSSSIQFLASGSAPGVLNPGERQTVPVYFAGLLKPWDFSDNSVEMELRIFDAGNSESIPWSTLKGVLRPDGIDISAWDVIFNNLSSGVGATWGGFVEMLSRNARHLDRLGRSVVDVSQLWGLEVDRALSQGPLRALSSSVDAAVASAGGDLVLSRSFAGSIDQRHVSSLFGFGWSTPWSARLEIGKDDSVTVVVPGGGFRRFQPDSRSSNKYFASPGDSGTLVRISSGIYEVREQDGSLTRYTSSGRIDYTRDANGNRITATHSGGRLVKLTSSSGSSLTLTYNTAGLVSKITDSAGRSTHYTYDSGNRYLLTVTGPDGVVSTYAYETSGGSPSRHALRSVKVAGTSQDFTYDSKGRLASVAVNESIARVTFSYGAAGTVFMTDAAGATTSLSYDDRGLLARVVDPLGHVTTAQYGADRRLESIVDALGFTQSFTWCGCGSLASTTDQAGNSTRLTYEYVGPNNTIRRMTSMVDAIGRVTKYTYDAKGDLLGTIHPDGSVEQFTAYNSHGNPLSYINRRGQAMSHTYNTAGQITRQVFADGSAFDFTYDSRGNLITSREPGNKITSFQYDLGDRLTKVIYPQGRFLSFTYDTSGRRTTMTDHAGYVLSYTYDSAGRLWKLTDNTASSPIVTYSHDGTGRLSREDNANGTYTEYAYDAAGQILSIHNRAPNGSVNSRFVYTYDAIGRRTAMDTVDGTWTYGYDAVGQLIRAVFSPAAGSPVPAQDLAFVYDAAGNRLRTIENGKATNYTTNTLNQYITIGSDTLAYDADGNLVSRSGPSGHATYTYNQVGQITRVTTPEGVWEYEYDPFGSRRATIHSGERTEYLIDPAGIPEVVGEYLASGVMRARNVHGIGMVSRDDMEAGSRYFYDYDAVGSTAAMTGVGGEALVRYFYSPYGEVLYRSGAYANPFDFVGQFGVIRDGSNMLWMRSRAMSAEAGRFVSTDTLQFASGQTNWYVYALNQPNTYVDITGTIVTLPFVAAGAALGSIIGAGWYAVHSGLSGTGTWQGLAGAAAGGAITGGIVTATGGAAWWGIGAGAAGSGIQYGIEHAGNGSFSAGDLGINIAIGGFAGLIPVRPFGGLKPNVPWAQGTPGFKRTITLHHKNKYGNAIAGSLIVGGFAGTAAGTGINALRPPDGQSGGAGGAATSTAVDPNALYAPAGFGPENFHRSDALLPYRIEFENYGPGSVERDGTPAPSSRWATAPAQRVEVSNTLPASLDLDTFALTGFGFGDINIVLPAAAQSWQQIIPMTFNGQTFDVWFDATMDRSSRTLNISFQSAMAESPLPPDVMTGFLPPEDGTGRGMGFITYTARPLAALPTGTAFRNIAIIRFDGQTAIATNQVDPLDPSKGTNPEFEALVTLDAGRPASSVAALPAATAEASFQVSWSGSDDTGGSGIAGYNVYVSTDGGAYSLWRAMTTQTSGTFNGQPGRTYRFYSVAVDNVGHEEQPPSSADATTQVISHALAARANQLFGASAGAIGNLNISMLSAMGQPILFQQSPGESAWSGVDLQAKSASPDVTGEVVTWVDPKDGLTYAAAMTTQGLVVFTNTSGTNWIFRILSTEVAGMPAITGNLTAFISIDGLVSIAGVAGGGDLIRYYQTGAGTAAGFEWSAINHGDDLRAQGLSMPQFTGRITSFVTSWNALNVVGLDASGQIQAVWWHQSLATAGKWTTNNLSAQTGAPALIGGLTVWLTSWNAINIAGTDVNGKLSATWWVPDFNDNRWNNSNLTDEIGGPLLEASSMTSWVTPWGAMNIAGREADGTIGVYWWVPNYNNNQWQVVHFRDVVPDATPTAGPVTGITALAGGNSMSILSTSGPGDVMRLWWSPSSNAWAEENLTQTAVVG